MATITEEKEYAWKEEQEQILKKWADKALCFKMMHERAHKRYWCLNAWFNIPVIIISTITGTGNFASNNFGPRATFVIFALGALNIFAGILATIATYTGVAQKLEAHRYSSVSWDKFARKVQIELAKARLDRAKVKNFIKQAAEDYDRLIEMSPILQNDIIRWFTNMIETGEFEEDIGELGTCCFESFCFPCGCSYCSCLSCSCLSFFGCFKKEIVIDENADDAKKLWKQIELPEVIGRIKPTEIASEPIPDSPPPLVIIEHVVESTNTIETIENRKILERTCPTCKKEFNFASRLKSHLETTIHCKKTDSEIAIFFKKFEKISNFKCDICNYKYTKRQNLQRHIEHSSCKNIIEQRKLLIQLETIKLQISNLSVNT